MLVQTGNVLVSFQQRDALGKRRCCIPVLRCDVRPHEVNPRRKIRPVKSDLVDPRLVAAISQHGQLAAKKIETATKTLQKLGMMKKPSPRARKAPKLLAPPHITVIDTE